MFKHMCVSDIRYLGTYADISTATEKKQRRGKAFASESKLNILEDLTSKKSHHPVIAILHDWENLVLYVLTLDLIKNAL